jgi:hypothetical protein
VRSRRHEELRRREEREGGGREGGFYLSGDISETRRDGSAQVIHGGSIVTIVTIIAANSFTGTPIIFLPGGN